MGKDLSIFLSQLVGFAIIVYIIWRWAVPPVKKLMEKQQDQVRTEIADAEKAAARLDEAKAAYQNSVSRARSEAARVREEARSDAQHIGETMRVQADEEAVRIQHHGTEQVELQRQQLIRQLQAELGTATVNGAAVIVRERMTDSAEQARSVDSFLDELESMAASVPAKEGS